MNLEFFYLRTVLHHVRKERARHDPAIRGHNRILNPTFDFLQ